MLFVTVYTNTVVNFTYHHLQRMTYSSTLLLEKSIVISPEQKCIVYGQFNGHCCAIASASDAKKLKLSLYAVRGVSNFDNAEWSKDVHLWHVRRIIKRAIEII